MTETKPGADAPRIAPDPRPDAVMPTVPAIEREERAEDLEPGDAVDGPIAVSAEVPETIEATIDFSEVELADEFSEPELAVTPGGLLPMEPSPIEGRLRKAPLRVPDELEECGGFTLFGRRIKSLLYTTDVAVIRNSNADAIFAVYPFTAQPAITQALLTASEAPVFVGVGGGITTDLCGFAASVYKRGIRFGFVPTTLLAQVDASIGGKNGVNFHAYKNMVGTITQPEWIYICTDALRTLSPREFRAGIAEVLKTFILFDAEYYRKAVDYFARMEAHLRKAGTCCGGECVYGQEELTEIIRKTALYKCAVVERDAFEKGERRLLNLGHTFAHAIEKNCPIMHGEAVAIGLVLAAGVSERLGLAPAGLAVGLAEDLKKVGLPTQSPIAIGVLLEALEKDKKVEGDAIHFILPRAVGEVVDRAIPLKQLEEVARDLR